MGEATRTPRGTRTYESVTYALVVRTRDGRVERVGTWRASRDRAMHFTAGTSATKGDIASVQVTTADGRPVLRLAPG